jgi:O-antigen ligase
MTLAKVLSPLRTLWFSGFVLIFALGLDQFFYATKGWPEPKMFYLAWLATGALLFHHGFSPRQFIREPLVRWGCCYLALSLLCVPWAEDVSWAWDGLKLVFTTELLILTAVVAFPRVVDGEKWFLRVALFAIGVITVSIAYDLLNPGVLVPIGLSTSTGIVGRGGGFLLNPNSAAVSLVVLQLAVVPRLTPRLAAIISTLTVVGVLLTFSRGGLIAWVTMILLQVLNGRLSRWFGVAVITVAFSLIVFAQPVIDRVYDTVDPAWTNSITRIQWMLGTRPATDFAAQERAGVFEYGVQQFRDSPLFGHGLGYTWGWGNEDNTHNLILRHLVEYGIIGALIFPTFLLAFSLTAVAENSKSDAITAVVVSLVIGLFSHDVLEQGFFLVPLLCLAMLRSARELRRTDRYKGSVRIPLALPLGSLKRAERDPQQIPQS